MPNSLIIEQAVVHYGTHPVLKGVDLHVPCGTCLVLLGPSGCGKTTLLNVISGSVSLKAGRLKLGDQALDDPAARRFVPMRNRGFAMVFQDFSLWPHMSVGENVAFGLKVRGISKADRENKVREALRKTRMIDCIDRRPAALSGGQQQRVAIARALAVNPEVLLLDEPLSALDAKLREELKAELKLLLEETGQTAVYVTHDQSEAYALGHQVALMREGMIEQCADPETIYRQPHSRYVADFLGGANLLSFFQADGRLHIAGLGAFPARPDFPAKGICFLRREALTFQPAAPPAELQCVVNQFLGARYALRARTSEGLELQGDGRPEIRSGDAVRPVFAPESLGLFPGELR